MARMLPSRWCDAWPALRGARAATTSVDKARKVLLIAVPLLLGLFIASATMTQWSTVALFFNQQIPSVRRTPSSVWITVFFLFAPFFPHGGDSGDLRCGTVGARGSCSYTTPYSIVVGLQPGAFMCWSVANGTDGWRRSMMTCVIVSIFVDSAGGPLGWRNART